MKRSKIEYSPIGIIHSPFSKPTDMPCQPGLGKNIKGIIEVFPEYQEGLTDLDGFSHIVILCHLHLSTQFHLRIIPRLETEKRGLFATRSPRRPNPIALSIVRLDNIEENRLFIRDLDMVEGTPVLDIKPYINESYEDDEIRLGWLENIRSREIS